MSSWNQLFQPHHDGFRSTHRPCEQLARSRAWALAEADAAFPGHKQRKKRCMTVCDRPCDSVRSAVGKWVFLEAKAENTTHEVIEHAKTDHHRRKTEEK
ncbi:hypothetical protein RSOLAG22IIIB_12886 [Rhizoctonia solani]|uniref:Uncharacterized protein n=1 Tax=Rhizoctonia solani TaxID=456999 RepID=A0A0K6GGZ7_9AGAM|nr:hypothetical protein RSOLAG22IIIB_12886 [Rhizoctonia solani]